MAEFPALPLFTDAITADCSHLSDEEFGRYVRLLILMWRSPQCRVPDDPTWLSKRLRVDALAYQLHIHPILQEFCTLDAGWWTQKRLQKEFLYVQGVTEKRRNAANARWSKTQEPENKGNSSMQMDMQGTSTRNAPTPTPTPNNNRVPIPNKIQGEEFEEFFRSYPKQTAIGTARSSFTNAILLRGATAERIINAAKNFTIKCKAMNADERKFIPNPSKWLDSECYNDTDLQAEAKPELTPESFPEFWQQQLARQLGVAKVNAWFTRLVHKTDETLIFGLRQSYDHVKNNYMYDLGAIGIHKVELRSEMFK